MRVVDPDRALYQPAEVGIVGTRLELNREAESHRPLRAALRRQLDRRRWSGRRLGRSGAAGGVPLGDSGLTAAGVISSSDGPSKSGSGSDPSAPISSLPTGSLRRP